MSITPERLDELAIDLAQKQSGDGWLCGPDAVAEFARALLSAVEAELKPVAYAIPINMEYLGTPGNTCTVIRCASNEDYSEPLFALPLIKEKP